MIDKLPLLKAEVERHPYPLLFTTVSGAHLYGFPSPDSDFDLRGVHLRPLELILGLDGKEHETVESTRIVDGTEIDLVTHDARKFFSLMLKRNGYVLEQVFSPLVVHRRPEFEELRDLAKRCITRHHVHHYVGFANTEWKLFLKHEPRVKPLLYVFRVLLTGIHLMRTGEVEANITVLAPMYGFTFVDELVAQKVSGTEKGAVQGADLAFYEEQFELLMRRLVEEGEESDLPEEPLAREGLIDLLLRLRLGQQSCLS